MRRFAIALAACVAAGAGAAEPLELSGALERVAGHPAAARVARLAEAEDARAVAAGTLPNPQLTLGAMSLPVGSWALGREPMTQLVVGWMQRLPAPGVLGFSRKAHEARARVLRNRVLAVRLALAADAYAAWWRVRAEQAALAAARRRVQALSQAAEAALARYKAGFGLQQDLWLAEVALEEARAEEDRVRQRLARAKAALAALVDLPASEIAIPDAPWRLPPERRAQWLARFAEASPLLAAARWRVRAAEAAHARAQAARLPDVQLGASFGARRGRSDLASAWIGIEVPLFVSDKEKREIAAAQAEAEAAREALAALHLSVRAEVEKNAGALPAALAEAERLHEELTTSAERLVASMRAGYAAGKVDFLNYAQAIAARERVEARAWRAAARAWALAARAAAAAGDFGFFGMDEEE